MMHRSPRRVGLAVLVAFLVAGCGGGMATVSGKVTYDGSPVEDGTITFLPADGKGPSAGGKISGGSYVVDNLTPGPKVVQIVAVKKVPFARSSEEMAKRAAADRARGDATGLIDPADVIPADAEGNNAKVELEAGKQTHDFDLKKPAKRKGRG